MNQPPGINKPKKLSLEEFLETYPILKVAGDLELYDDYQKKEKKLLKRYGKKVLNRLIHDQLSEIKEKEEKTHA